MTLWADAGTSISESRLLAIIIGVHNTWKQPEMYDTALEIIMEPPMKGHVETPGKWLTGGSVLHLFIVKK